VTVWVDQGEERSGQRKDIEEWRGRKYAMYICTYEDSRMKPTQHFEKEKE
jgi:hypothetical protein